MASERARALIDLNVKAGEGVGFGALSVLDGQNSLKPYPDYVAVTAVSR